MEKSAEEVTDRPPAPREEPAAPQGGARPRGDQPAEQEATTQAAGEAATGEAPRPRRRRGGWRRKVCAFCADKVYHIDYKDVGRLGSYLSARAKIDPRRKTGTCGKHQRRLSVALKRARFLALLPYTPEHARVGGVGPRS